MNRRLLVLALSLPAVLALAPAARAGLILQPAAVSTNMGSSGGTSPNNVRNQSGLSAPYISLVTDFDAYIASNPTHNSLATTSWQSGVGSLTGNFDFTLGGSFVIESFALWTLGGSPDQALRDFTLLADDNAAFSSPVILGSFTSLNPGPITAASPEVFAFAPTPASFVRMMITSNNGGFATIFSEGAFELQTPAPPAVGIPEPSSLALLGLGLAGLAGAAWRRRRNQARAVPET